MYRDHTKEVQIGNVTIGGGNPIRIQSMTNTKTEASVFIVSLKTLNIIMHRESMHL